MHVDIFTVGLEFLLISDIILNGILILYTNNILI